MFAYCGNNPADRTDSTGHAFMQMRFDPDGATNMLAPILWGGANGSGAGVASSARTSKVLREIADVVLNSSESVVEHKLRRNGVAFYKGALVFSSDLLAGTSACSFGIIVLGSGNIGHEEFEKTLNHEYGHTVHASQIGLVDYAFTTAVPSLVGAALSSENAWISNNYYSLPWERVAEYWGDVNRGYLSWADSAGSVFWVGTLIVSSITRW
jgi:hypothetical protein